MRASRPPRIPVWPGPFLRPAGAFGAAAVEPAAIGGSLPGACQISWFGREAFPLRLGVLAAHPTGRSQLIGLLVRPGLKAGRCRLPVAPVVGPAVAAPGPFRAVWPEPDDELPMMSTHR